ncbi:hypothetical protein [Methylobacterium nodulans]|uniref:Uncharacterized protein n=1 Tax=Methylobacterium nodulans (strain LMG 21967 / CNCM I-2342 / ORS 2060) TaxID=460265 RepID=B8ICW1_METNO|nr:hypothetical protein [Methylobacterium nodulans]ACL57522.1 hypothetical protein Mnod_2558 [Methylobacterium nodulans ORS 2060]
MTINVVANGGHIEFVRADARVERFLGTSVIWRVIEGLLLALGNASPIAAH